VVQEAPTNLLRNGLFTFDIPEGGATAPIGWGCSATAEQTPSGTYHGDEWMGRTALRLLRTEGTATSKTGCEQRPELDVSQFNYLELKSTFVLNYQSLQNCGIDGSECPLMFFIIFTDAEGITHEWSQGIFYNQVAQTSDPSVCLSCGMRSNHLPISEQVWFTYESGNLLDLFPDEQRPQYINRVQFYAKGHRYDVFVSEVALYASRLANIPTQQLGNDGD
jgi:hypothetical protein